MNVRRRLLKAGFTEKVLGDAEDRGIGILMILSLLITFGPLAIKLVKWIIDQMKQGKSRAEALEEGMALARRGKL